MTTTLAEHRETFPCFGSECTVIVTGGAGAEALGAAKRRLLAWHQQFSRFEPDSELSRLRADPRQTVPISPLMRRILQAGIAAADSTGGLVDFTLGAEVQDAGYERHFEGTGVPLAELLSLAPPRRPGGPAAGRGRSSRWRLVDVDRRAGTVSRPAGLTLDPGGIAKGVFADELASLLAGHDAFVVDCAGDLRLGGRGQITRAVHVASPFDDSTLHTFELSRGGVATSGIGKRSWLSADGRPAHHLLDPASGEPAFTGVVQATALAPTATEAETLSKAAILSGPAGAARWLAHGGVVVLDDGTVEVLSP